MDNFMKEFQHLEIKLDEIKSSTENFDKSRLIGKGGFGNVYRGDISHYKGRSVVAIKRLDRRHGQGDKEFLTEIMTLSRYTHKNLISLVGFCSEGDEKILVYELASRGSLEDYLSSTTLTWMQRLKICVDAARGLSYLHDPRDSHQRVLHRDIKCPNILLDENWTAKIADMGLSKFGPANQQHTVMISNAVGTIGYVDPLYIHTGMLTKESDVYSFGVVLFEVLCGRLCCKRVNGEYEIFVRRWKQSYELKKLDEIIFKDLIQQMDSTSLEKFSNIAFQCLHESREQRPTMANVLENLEAALHHQEIHERMKLPKDYKEIIETSDAKILTFEEVSKHNRKTDCWLIISGKVYDVTPFLDDHPGGDEVLILVTKKDATEDFEDVGHSQNARDMMKDYYVGDLDSDSLPNDQKNKYNPPSATGSASNQASGSSSTNILTFILPILILVLAYAL